MLRTKPFIFAAERGGAMAATGGKLVLRLYSGQDATFTVKRGNIIPARILAVLPGTTAHAYYFENIMGGVHAMDTIKHLASVGHPH